jgi:16S rRNA (cytidine1402-2'-O)-methyltransferase
MSGTLFVVGTPIGNLGDLSPRARECLASVNLVIAEDTRVFGRLCHLVDLRPHLVRGYQGRLRITDAEFSTALEEGDVALVSDAGMPGVSDPGAAYVALALAQGAKVSPVPGPSVLSAALALWPQDLSAACFYGFLPRHGQERKAMVERLMAAPAVGVFLESPKRLGETLAELAAIDGDRYALLLGELTKLHESIRWMTLAQAHVWLMTVDVKGEWAVAIDRSRTPAPSAKASEPLLAALARSSLGTKEAATIYAEARGIAIREAYQLMVARRSDGDEPS